MRRCAILALVFLLASIFAAEAAEKKRPEYHKKFFEPSEDVATPHIAWAKPYGGGRVRALFITHRQAMREVIEIAQRLSMDYKVFATESSTKLGETGIGVDASWKVIKGNTDEELTERLRSDLKADYDVIVIASVNWDVLPLDCQYEILKKIKAGTGLAGYVLGGTEPYLEQVLRKEDFAWRYGLWSGAANNVPDYFGIGEFEGSVDAAEKHGGDFSLRIIGKKAIKGSKESPRAAYSCPVAEPLVAGAEYRFRVWYKTKDLQEPGASAGVLPLGSARLTPSDMWKEYTATLKCKKDGAGSIYLWNHGVGQVWFDDVSLVKVGEEGKELARNGGFERGSGVAVRDAVVGGVPFPLLPAFASDVNVADFFMKYCRYADFGKGRVLLLKSIRVPRLQGMTPGAQGDVLDIKQLDYDYYLSLAIKSILWAARREAPVHVATESPMVTIPRLGEKERLVTFHLRSELAIPNARLKFALRNEDNVILHSAEKAVNLSAGESSVDFAFPPAPAGRCFADVWIVKGDNVLGWGSVGLNITSPSRITELKPAKESFKVAEAIAGSVAIDGAQDGMTLKTALFDNFGRLLAAADVPLKNGQKDVPFSLRGIRTLSILQTVSATLMKGQDAIEVKKRSVPVSDFFPDREDVRFVMWQSFAANDYISPLMAREFYRKGIDTQYTGFSKWAFRENMWFLPYAIRFTDKKTDWYQLKRTRTKEDLVRDPCLTDPKYLEEVTQTLTKAAKQAGDFSTDDFSLGDECLFVSGRYDLCFSPTCIASFREYAKKEYGDLAKLNKEYGTSYKSWDEVMPGLLVDAEKTGRYAAWVDHRLHMESVWAGIYESSRRIIRDVVPTARVGYEGSNTHIDSWSAGDYHKLMNSMDLNNIYYRPFIADAIRDFGGPKILFGGGWYGGYAGNRNEAHMRWFPWMTLLYGANSFWVWNGYGSAGSVMAFDLSLYPFFEDNCEELREIKRGIGKLIALSTREDDGIAVLYSPASVHVNTITKDMPTLNDAYTSVSRLLEDIGLQYRIVASEEVEKGVLKSGRFKVVFLCMAQAMSDAEAAEVRDFVERGGMVIADVRPAVTNEHGTARAVGALDDLFGVKQDASVAAFKIGPIEIQAGEGVTFSGKLPEYSFDGSLMLSSGKALGRAGETPTMIVNAAGKGKSAILNFSFASYCDSRKAQDPEIEYPGWEEGKPTRALLRDILKLGGVEAPVKIEPEPPQCQIGRFKLGGVELVGVLPSLPRNGMAYTLKEATIPPAKSARVTFHSAANLYDVRSGKHLGRTESCETPLQPGRAKLFALMPYRVTGVKLATGPRVVQGEPLPLKIAVEADGKPGVHVIRLTVFDPKGAEVAHYARNVKSVNGTFDGDWTPALNEAPGAWQIEARDVLSGQTARSPVEVTKR